VKRFLRRLWDTFVSGLLAILPVGGLFYILWFLYRLLDGLVGRNTPFGNTVEQVLGRWIPGMGFYMLAILILLIGLVTRNFLGRTLQYAIDRIILSLPGIRKMYGTLKQFTSAVLSRNASSFQKVVMFEYPRPGLYVIGLVTNEKVGKLGETIGEDSLLVYAPTAPNPLSGMMLIIPKRSVTYLDMPVDDALSMVLSSGSVLPQSLEGTEQEPPPRPRFNPFARRG